MRKQVPILLAITASLLPVIAFFFPNAWINEWFNQKFDEWMVIIASFAFLLGIVSMV